MTRGVPAVKLDGRHSRRSGPAVLGGQRDHSARADAAMVTRLAKIAEPVAIRAVDQRESAKSALRRRLGAGESQTRRMTSLIEAVARPTTESAAP
jgi:hypothetical protein